MIPRKECPHDKLQFGSGDYYIFCQACGAWWGHIEPNGQKLSPETANQGIGGQQSGTVRVKLGAILDDLP